VLALTERDDKGQETNRNYENNDDAEHMII